MTTERRFDFRLIGRRCSVFGASERQEQALKRYWQYPATSAQPQPFSINIHFTSSVPREFETAGTPRFTASHDLTVTWQQHGLRCWRTHCDDAGVQLTISPEASDIIVWGRPAATAELTLQHALHIALSEALRSTGLAPLHAAVIVRNGEATALLGCSGVGKSSTLLRAMQLGWAPLAEDFAWLDSANCVVYGWDRGVHLTEDAVSQFHPDWKQKGWRRQPAGKLFLSYRNLPQPRVWQAQLTRLVLLHRSAPRASGWEPMASYDAVRALYEAAGVPLCRISRDEWAQRVPELLRRLETARLILGRTELPL